MIKLTTQFSFTRICNLTISLLMLFLFIEIHTVPISTESSLLIIKTAGTHSYHLTPKD